LLVLEIKVVTLPQFFGLSTRPQSAHSSTESSLTDRGELALIRNFLLIGMKLLVSEANFPYGKLMIRSSSDFGALIRAKRKALGWTQAELAARCGTGERFIVELEGGKPTCHLEKSLIAARVVGIELGEVKAAAPPEAGSQDDALAHLPRYGS
jgi:HTH-type transcriptional regulator/antitoxin HipB